MSHCISLICITQVEAKFFIASKDNEIKLKTHQTKFSYNGVYLLLYYEIILLPALWNQEQLSPSTLAPVEVEGLAFCTLIQGWKSVTALKKKTFFCSVIWKRGDPRTQTLHPETFQSKPRVNDFHTRVKGSNLITPILWREGTQLIIEGENRNWLHRFLKAGNRAATLCWRHSVSCCVSRMMSLASEPKQLHSQEGNSV